MGDAPRTMSDSPLRWLPQLGSGWIRLKVTGKPSPMTEVLCRAVGVPLGPKRVTPRCGQHKDVRAQNPNCLVVNT
eukprot:1069951-Prorocentrum_lima.AAC.1